MTVQNGDSGDKPNLSHVASGSDSNVSKDALLLRIDPQQQPSQQPPQPNKDGVGAETTQVELPKTNETDLTPSPYTTSSMTGDASTDRSQTFWGYIDAKKIAERTGIAIEHFVTFGIKEIVDNSCDDLENNPTSLLWAEGSPTVVVHITKNKDLLHIVIRNLNRGNKISFYTDRLIRIFNYNRFHSSKGGNVSRGQLGDALKEILTMAYALTNSRDETGTGEDKQWNGALVIRHNKTEFKVCIHVDRKNERIIPVFSPEITVDSIAGYTEIEFTMPIIFESINMASIIQFCKKYTLTPTHIAFDFNFLDKDMGHSGRFTTPVTHVISSNFRNPRSVYCHHLRDFQNFTYSIPNHSETVHDALVSRDFRESNYNYFGDHLGLAIGDTTTVERLRNSDRLIKQVFDLLRRNMQPMRTLSVSHTLDYKRKNALLDRFESIKPDSLVIDREARYIGKNGTITITKDGKLSCSERDYINRETNDTAIKFPFIFEIIAIPIKSCRDASFLSEIKRDGLVFIGSVNYSTTPADSRAYFEDNTADNNSPYTFDWDGKGGDNIIQLLRDCGYASDAYNEYNKISPKNQKQPCVIIAHLVSPKIEYLAGYGKSFLNLRPYASMIAKETVELIKKIPSKLKYDNHLRDMERARRGKPKDSIIYYERLLIRDRWERIKQRPGWKKGTIYLKEWVQSSVWYNLNKQYLIPNGVKVTAHTRDYVTSNIRRLCAELETECEVSREEVGITASTRAFLYFNGAWLAVDISKIEELSKLGTDQVFIEKRGGIDQVTTSVGHFGIAFCNTQGHFVEYAEDLTKVAKSAKANIATITDWDCAGINIAERVMVRENENDEYDDDEDFDESTTGEDDNKDEEKEDYIERLGIDPIDTLIYFDLRRENVEQIYPLKLNKEGHLKKGKDGFELMNPGSNVTSPIISMTNKYHSNNTKYWRYKYIADDLSYLLGTVNLRIMAKRYQADNVKFAQYKYISDNLPELTRNTAQEAKRIEIDAVIEELSVRYGDGKGGEMFGNYIMDMLHICFPERNYNRANKKLAEYFGPKFVILPPRWKKLFMHAVNIADGAVEGIENDIEEEQEKINGFLNVSEKGEEDIKRLAEAVVKDPDAKLLDVQLKKVDIIEYYNDNTKKLAESANISIKDCQYITFVLKYGTEEQKEQVISGKRSASVVYKDVLKQMKQKRKSKKRGE